MQVQVKFFAVLRELVGQSEEWITCDEGATVADVLATLVERYPSLKGKMERLAIAVDQQYASHDTVLSDKSEVALLPPVAGGAPERLSEESLATHFQVLEKPLQPALLNDLVMGDFGGAVVSFVGMVRKQSQGRIVERLDYEAYVPMAVKELQRIGQEVREKWPQASVAIHHRIGSLQIGELAVVIAVCTPHRQAGFDACSYTIERLKETVPIWKKEFFTDGSTWVGWGP